VSLVPVIFHFRLYVVDGAPNSTQAIFNLKALCREHLPDRHHIEIVDVFVHPKRALDDGIPLTPMLVKFLPEPLCIISGTLSKTQFVLRALGIGTSV